MKEKILITSATGKTGYETAVQLLKDDCSVKIYVRSKNRRALELEKLGAEIAIGEFNDYEQFKNALSDVNKVYYCHPFMPGMPANVKLFIEAAKESNIEAVVFMGQWLAEFDNAKSLMTNDTKEAYRSFKESGLNVVYLTPGYFAENTFVIVLEFALQLGLMPLPYGKGKNPVISNEDLGSVIAALLKNPSPYFGQKIHPTGPESLSVSEMAKVISKVSGRKVRYINIPEWMFLKFAFLFGKDFGFDAFTIAQARHYNREYRQNKFDAEGTTAVVKNLTGREPEDFETIVKRYISRSPYAKRSFSTWFSAMRKFMKIPFTSIPSIKELEALNK